MSSLARVALLFLLAFSLVRPTAAASDELALLRAKAERGNALAQYNLGLAYIEGRLAAPDPAEAFVWLTLASESGATGKALDSVLGSITDQQLAEGRRRLGVYRAALAAKTASLAALHDGSPKLAPRGFTLEAPSPPAPAATDAPVTAAPDAVPAPITTSPAAGSDALTRSQQDLEEARADLAAANTELVTLRASVSRLEAAAAQARDTEARLTTELAEAREQLAIRPPPTAPVETPKTADSPAHEP